MQTTCQHCSAATLWPPWPSAASLCAHTPTDTYFNLIPTTAYRKTLGDWHPPPPHLPHYTPFSSSPSTPTDPLSGGLLFTFTLLHGPAGLGGRAESLHYCLVVPCIPLPCQPGLTPFTDLKSTICMTQQSGSKGERDGARRGVKTRRGERGWRLRMEERELERGISKGAALAVLKYPSNSLHHMKLFCYFSFFRHCAYWFFYSLLLYIPLISTFQNLLILSDYPLVLDPLLLLHPSLHHPPPTFVILL